MEGRTGSTELSLTSTFVLWHAYSYTRVHTSCMHTHTCANTHGVLHMYTHTLLTHIHTHKHTLLQTLLYAHTLSYTFAHTYTLPDAHTHTSTLTNRLKTGTEMSQTSDNLSDHLVGHTRARTST